MMTPTPALASFDDVRTLLAAADPEQALAPCRIRRIHRGTGAIGSVADSVADVLGAEPAGPDGSARVTMIVDRKPIMRQGEDVKAMVENQLRERYAVRREVLDDGYPELHVSEDVVEAAARAAAGADAVVAVGGGTISDIGKLATDRAAARALVAVQTAASVDGYTDDVSVILRGGVKRTVPSRWPDVVIADAETIAGAPAVMNRAGYGEMTSMFTAPADWRLASLVGLETSFHWGPIRLLEAVGRDIDAWSPGVRTGDQEAVERLTWALAVRGIATGVAGTTACLSGVEHLVSHMLDLHHGERGLPIGLHGAQVGVASVVAAAAWEMLFDRMTSGAPPDIAASALDPSAAQDRVQKAFAGLDPTGRIGAECWSDYSRKLSACAGRQDAIRQVLAAWTDHEPELRALGRSSARIGAGLRATGSAATFADLNPAVAPELSRWAIESCALMRNRFTVVDLLTLLGWWGPADVDELVERAQMSAVGRGTEVGHVR
jgi:glycerol-1-phosphate dehydrogenase [NAD(P)+]